MPSSLFVIVHALGAVQGVFLAAILSSKARGSLPNRILSLVMLAFAVDLGMAVYHAAELHVAFPHFIGVDYPLAVLYGPLIYLYARTLSLGETSLRRAYLWHFVPFALLVALALPLYLGSGAAKLAFLNDPTQSAWGRALAIANHLKLVHALAYIGVILVLLRRHRARMEASRSSAERVNLVWLRNLMYAIVALTGITIVLYVLSLQSDGPVIGLDPDTRYDDYMLLALAIFVYAIGYFGLRQPEVFDARFHAEGGWTNGRPVGAGRESAAGGDGEERPRYARSGMDEAAADRYVTELERLMAVERLYRRGDLTLQELADAGGMPAHHITEALNTRLDLNFYDFVNGYRVRDVMERLADPSNAHLTILSIGMDAGFNSKSSFNLVFKKHTRMTPSEYRARAIST